MARQETVHRLVGGRYTLLEPLGRGGMGTVWRAHDGLLQREVAVKHVAIPPALGDSERASVRDRVMREAQAAARLSHSASVTVFDVLEGDGSVYIVMELLQADTLAKVIGTNGPLGAAEAARVGLELVGALEAAHRQGVVHRDVKPSNVMMLPTGAVKLTDFGIASVKDHPSLTSTGQVLGSPSYMAPEQALGHPSGPAADWWGLGATLYYALEGRPPFDRPGAIPTLTAVVNEDPAPMARGGVLTPVVGRLLAKEPGARPGGPELRRLLRRHLGEADGAGQPDEGGDAHGVTTVAAAPPPPPAPPVDSPRSDDTLTSAPAATTPPSPPSPAAPGADAPTHPVPRQTAAVADSRHPSPPPASPPPSGRDVPAVRAGERSRGPAVGAILAVVALLAGVIVWASSAGENEPRQPASQTAPDEDESGDDETSTTAARSEDRAGAGATAPTTAVALAEGVPADWVSYTDPKTGYRIAHPPGWQVLPLDGTRTDITDPSTGAYLRVDWTDTPGPSPEGAWAAQSKSFGARQEAYQEIRIEPTTYKGFDAAIWEYVYSARGARLHAVNLGMVTGKYGFALNFQTSEERWAASQAQFETFKAAFQVPA